jgi:hypothetical protein
MLQVKNILLGQKWVLLWGLTLLVGCATPGQISGKKASSHRVFTHSIDSEAAFNRYSKKVAGDRFTKFIIDLRTSKIYYFDVNVYKLHVDFVFKEIYRRKQNPAAIIRFNRNYDERKPGFLLCYLVHHEQPDIWTLSFWEGDEATPEHIRLAFRRMKATFFKAGKVRFRPDSTQQEVVAKRLTKIKTITNDKIYRITKYHAFHPGNAVGKLRIVEKTTHVAQLQFNNDEIVVLAQVLPDITPVRGIITEQFSTPLSHLALRARAWGVPHVGLKGAIKKLLPLNGKMVRFEAKKSGYKVRPATAAEIDAETKRRNKKRKIQLPPIDLSQRKLRRLINLNMGLTGAYGAKAANLGELRRMRSKAFTVPAGFAIPIAYYSDHMKAHGLDTRVNALLSEARFKTDPAYRRQALEKLRKAIVAAPMDQTLRLMVRRAFLGLGKEHGVFVRSSTNAEDLPGFNGAGLYDTVANVKTTSAVTHAVKVVWASVWNLRAYEERSHFGIDHRGVYGAVLIQLGVNATAAGVLITANIFDKNDKTTYTINAKRGLGLRVVEGKTIPEQVLFDTSNMGIKVLSRSDEKTILVFDDKGGVKEVRNPQHGKPILSDDRVVSLGLAAQEISGRFPKVKALDLEWLFVGNTLYVVQSRPYVSAK